jgi:hypothetical protein
VLAAAERLADNTRILFLMIGGGKRFDQMARTVKERRLERLFRFLPYQEPKMLSYSVATPDVHWISLDSALEGLIVPSKFYGIARCWKAHDCHRGRGRRVSKNRTGACLRRRHCTG